MIALDRTLKKLYPRLVTPIDSIKQNLLLLLESTIAILINKKIISVVLPDVVIPNLNKIVYKSNYTTIAPTNDNFLYYIN